MTEATPGRRQLDYRSFEELQADIDRLAAGPYHRCGQWDLATTCDHLSKTVEPFLEARVQKFTGIIAMLAKVAAPLILKRVLKTRRLPTGVKAPPFLVPEVQNDQAAAVSKAKELLKRAQTFQGPLIKHPLFGNITLEQWRQITLIHAAHHLSFLVPATGATNAPTSAGSVPVN